MYCEIGLLVTLWNNEFIEASWQVLDQVLKYCITFFWLCMEEERGIVQFFIPGKYAPCIIISYDFLEELF